MTLYIRFPLPLGNVEALLHEGGIDIKQETVRHRWNRLDPVFASEIRRKRVNRMRGRKQWRWRLDEAFVKINRIACCLWGAFDLAVANDFLSRKLKPWTGK